jgi:hypothetical protein
MEALIIMTLPQFGNVKVVAVRWIAPVLPVMKFCTLIDV